MRRSIYSAANSDISGRATANAGADQSEESIAALASLDGTGSSTTGGSITSYQWEIISGQGLVIDSPTSSTSTISGTAILGDTIVELTVTDTNGNTDTDRVTISIVMGDPLTISHSAPVSKAGTLTFSDGQPNEVIDLQFTLVNGNAPDAMSFTGVTVFGSLSYLNPSLPGQITLDGSGNGSGTYTGIGEYFQVTITITGRSSTYPIPPTYYSYIPIYT